MTPLEADHQLLLGIQNALHYILTIKQPVVHFRTIFNQTVWGLLHNIGKEHFLVILEKVRQKSFVILETSIVVQCS